MTKQKKGKAGLPKKSGQATTGQSNNLSLVNLPPEKEVVEQVKRYFFKRGPAGIGVFLEIFGEEKIRSGYSDEVVKDVVRIVMKQIKKRIKARAESA